jgi:hypothetical protein
MHNKTNYMTITANKFKILTFIFFNFLLWQAYGQDTIPLNELERNKEGNPAYNSDRLDDILISGWDYTYLTDSYSSKKTRFYHSGKLFSGVALIDNEAQYTLINFQNGQLNGLWYDIMHHNEGYMNKGNYKSGVRHGKWIEGSEIKNKIEIDDEWHYIKGKLEGTKK